MTSRVARSMRYIIQRFRDPHSDLRLRGGGRVLKRLDASNPPLRAVLLHHQQHCGGPHQNHGTVLSVRTFHERDLRRDQSNRAGGYSRRGDFGPRLLLRRQDALLTLWRICGKQLSDRSTVVIQGGNHVLDSFAVGGIIRPSAGGDQNRQTKNPPHAVMISSALLFHPVAGLEEGAHAGVLAERGMMRGEAMPRTPLTNPHAGW
jgi:hypothetical protein